jgi:cephalosporin-C deacetylase-like acetyl esterase
MRQQLLAASCVFALAISVTFNVQAVAPQEVAADVASLFRYEVPAGASFVVHRVKQVQGIELREISYASPMGGTVTASLLVPPGKGPFPLVIYGHWGNGTRKSFLPEGLALARAGVVVFMADAPFARADRESYKPLNGPDARDVYIQMVVDTRLGLDLLEREPSVDRSRVGYVGLSFGSQVGAILAGVDPRITALVLMGGLPRASRLLREGDRAELIRLRESIQDRAGFERFLSSLAQIDSEHFVRGRHAPLLFQFGTHDVFIPRTDAEEFVRIASAPKEARWYTVAHEFNDPESMNDRFHWLAGHLRFGVPSTAPEVAGAASTCGPPAAAVAPGTVEHSVHQLLSAFNARDLEAAMSHMAADVVLVHPGRPDADRAQVEAAFRQRWSAAPKEQPASPSRRCVAAKTLPSCD